MGWFRKWLCPPVSEPVVFPVSFRVTLPYREMVLHDEANEVHSQPDQVKVGDLLRVVSIENAEEVGNG